MVYDVWCMVFGVWCVVYSVWCMRGRDRVGRVGNGKGGAVGEEAEEGEVPGRTHRAPPVVDDTRVVTQ